MVATDRVQLCVDLAELQGWTDVRLGRGGLHGIDPEGNAGSAPDPLTAAGAEELRARLVDLRLEVQLSHEVDMSLEPRRTVVYVHRVDCTIVGRCTVTSDEEPATRIRERLATALAARDALREIGGAHPGADLEVTRREEVDRR